MAESCEWVFLRPGHSVWVPWGKHLMLTTTADQACVLFLPCFNSAVVNKCSEASVCAGMTTFFDFLSPQASAQKKPWPVVFDGLIAFMKTAKPNWAPPQLKAATASGEPVAAAVVAAAATASGEPVAAAVVAAAATASGKAVADAAAAAAASSA